MANIFRMTSSYDMKTVLVFWLIFSLFCLFCFCYYFVFIFVARRFVCVLCFVLFCFVCFFFIFFFPVGVKYFFLRHQLTISNKSSFDWSMAWHQDITLAIYYVVIAAINSRPIYGMKTILPIHLTPLNDVIMRAMASQITSLAIVYSIV